MRQMGRIGTALLLTAGLAGCGSASDQPSADRTSETTATVTEAPLAAGEKPAAFAQCAACHSVEPGKSGIGPSLHGVVGRKAASQPGFAYSAALKNSGLTWDEAGLDKWLASPLTMVPGNKMPYAGVKDPAKRKAVIDYLATLN